MMPMAPTMMMMIWVNSRTNPHQKGALHPHKIAFLRFAVHLPQSLSGTHAPRSFRYSCLPAGSIADSCRRSGSRVASFCFCCYLSRSSIHLAWWQTVNSLRHQEKIKNLGVEAPRRHILSLGDLWGFSIIIVLCVWTIFL